MPRQAKTFQVEALTYSDNFDSLVERHFRGRPLHRAEDSGAYKVSRFVEKFGGKLIRSRQEYLATPSGVSTQLEWASLCFQLEDEVFVTMMAKGNSLVRGRTGEDEYKITVTDKTVIQEEENKIQLSNLRVGDGVVVMGVPKGGEYKLEATQITRPKR